MRLTLLAALLAATPVLAQQDRQAAIEGVIADQLDAFNARDLARAWGHASPAIQRIFGDQATFGRMVETGYPMVWTNDGAEFLDLADQGGQVVQRALIRDAGGRGWLLFYEMIETPEGWKINGVAIAPAPDEVA